jgi:hypothetical protein
MTRSTTFGYDPFLLVRDTRMYVSTPFLSLSGTKTHLFCQKTSRINHEEDLAENMAS